MMKMRLQRFAYTPMGTFGRLTVNDKQWYTVERPWEGNKQQVSCIPEGVYTLRQRASQVIARSTGGAYARGWEVTGVPDRSFIMIHPGNTMDDLLGCISPGKILTSLKGKWAVGSSRPAFDEMMAEMASQDEWELTIDLIKA